MPHKKFSFFKHTIGGNPADSVETSYTFKPNDKHLIIHCKRTCCYYVFSWGMVAQKKANPELLNFHEVICGQAYQKLRFNVDAPMDFLKHVLPNFEKPALEAKPVKPEPTGLGLLDRLELGLYEEKLAEVRQYNDFVNKTSVNMCHGYHLMDHLKEAIRKTACTFYYTKATILNIHDLDENLLVFDSSDETKFSRHVITPGVHVENHKEARAFANKVVKNIDPRFRPAIDLGIYKSLQNFCLFDNRKVGSTRVKQYKSGTFKAFSDSLIAQIPEGSYMLPSILGKPAAKNAPKNDTELTEGQVQAVVKLVNESAPANTLKRVIGGMLLFTRTGAGHCPICERDHVNDNTHFVIVHEQCVCLHCRHSETHCSKKTSLVLGYLDSSWADGLRRAMSITADKIPD